MKKTLSSRAEVILVRSVRPAALLEKRSVFVIDLRSPAEHAVDHWPGAFNIPLFDDVDRALVGTLYRRTSPEAAFEQGRVIARAKIGTLVGAIARIGGLEIGAVELEQRVDELTAGGITGLSTAVQCELLGEPPENSIVLHCWRGGLRSRSVAGLLTGLGLTRILHLDGGYKAYRAEVARVIAAWCPPRPFVLHGFTGVGKTLVLSEIERLRPGWTIDLEALAGHRSSLLGMVGLEPRSQKAFESGLAARIRERPFEPLVLEGESRKVGDVILPPSLWRALSGGCNLELVASAERRLEVLKRDYLTSPSSRAELEIQLPQIEARMKLRAGEPTLVELLRAGRVDELVLRLLERYYDPLYRHGRQGRRSEAEIDATEPGLAAREIVTWIEGRIARDSRGTLPAPR